jgi:hypothetical protein
MAVAALACVVLGALETTVAGITSALAQNIIRVRGGIERIDGPILKHAMVPS